MKILKKFKLVGLIGLISIAQLAIGMQPVQPIVNNLNGQIVNAIQQNPSSNSTNTYLYLLGTAGILTYMAWSQYSNLSEIETLKEKYLKPKKFTFTKFRKDDFKDANTILLNPGVVIKTLYDDQVFRRKIGGVIVPVLDNDLAEVKELGEQNKYYDSCGDGLIAKVGELNNLGRYLKNEEEDLEKDLIKLDKITSTPKKTLLKEYNTIVEDNNEKMTSTCLIARSQLGIIKNLQQNIADLKNQQDTKLRNDTLQTAFSSNKTKLIPLTTGYRLIDSLASKDGALVEYFDDITRISKNPIYEIKEIKGMKDFCFYNEAARKVIEDRYNEKAKKVYEDDGPNSLNNWINWGYNCWNDVDNQAAELFLALANEYARLCALYQVIDSEVAIRRNALARENYERIKKKSSSSLDDDLDILNFLHHTKDKEQNNNNSNIIHTSTTE
jgi:hypothetical protein